MGLLDSFFDRFKKQPSIMDMNVDDLNRQRISLEQQQHKLGREGDRLGQDEIQLKSEYGEAQTENQKMRLARKIQFTRQRANGTDAKSAICHKQAQAINTFLMIKENETFFEQLGLSDVLKNTDPNELAIYIEQFSIGEEMNQDKLGQILTSLGDAEGLMVKSQDDEGLRKIRDELDGVATGGDKETVKGTSIDDAIAIGQKAAAQEAARKTPAPAPPKRSKPTKPAAEPDQGD